MKSYVDKNLPKCFKMRLDSLIIEKLSHPGVNIAKTAKGGGMAAGEKLSRQRKMKKN